MKRFTALKVLGIDCDDESFSTVLKDFTAAHIPLEYLSLSNSCPDREFVHEISKWKQLKKLKLDGVGDLKLSDAMTIVRNLSELTKLMITSNSILTTDLLEIVRCAPKLRKLKYYLGESAATLDEDLFMKIRDVVAKRNEKCPLILFSHDHSSDVSEKLRNANKGILEILN